MAKDETGRDKLPGELTQRQKFIQLVKSCCEIEMKGSKGTGIMPDGSVAAVLMQHCLDKGISAEDLKESPKEE